MENVLRLKRQFNEKIMPRRKKEKEYCSVARRMKTYMEFEDGAIVEYDFHPMSEDEYGSWIDTTSQWKSFLKDLENKNKKRITASIAKICETTTKTVKYSKDPETRITIITEVDENELLLKRNICSDGYLKPFQTSYNPDSFFSYDDHYMNHFNLVKEGWGNDMKIIKRQKS